MAAFVEINEILFTIGRMNPPTPGHLELIRTMIIQAISNNVPRIDIILSHSVGDSKNPLDCDKKYGYLVEERMIERLREQMIVSASENAVMQEKIANLHIVVRCMTPGRSPVLSAVDDMVNENIETRRMTENIIARIMVGADRDFTKMMVPHLANHDPPILFEQISVPRDNMEEYANMTIEELESIEEIPVQSISASFVRNVVMAQKYTLFSRLYANFLSQDAILEMYSTLFSVLTESSLVKKPKAKPAKAAKTVKATKPKPVVVKASTKAPGKKSVTASTKAPGKKGTASAKGGRGRRKTYKKYKKPLY
jgi:hypothetical protein